jgi:hypothetical protein
MISPERRGMNAHSVSPRTNQMIAETEDGRFCIAEGMLTKS